MLHKACPTLATHRKTKAEVCEIQLRVLRKKRSSSFVCLLSCASCSHPSLGFRLLLLLVAAYFPFRRLIFLSIMTSFASVSFRIGHQVASLSPPTSAKLHQSSLWMEIDLSQHCMWGKGGATDRPWKTHCQQNCTKEKTVTTRRRISKKVEGKRQV